MAASITIVRAGDKPHKFSWDLINQANPSQPSPRGSFRSISQVLNFINTLPPGGEGNRGDVHSIWSMVIKSLLHLHCLVSWEDNNLVLEWADHQVWAGAGKWRAMANFTHDAKTVRRLRLEKVAADQGRSFHLISQDPSFNHWIPSGAFTSFADLTSYLPSQ